ncbi:MAG: DHHA1 domain-containing protein [Deltaproteobacteria bacterium]|nr:DHHA1 domain-containing protein [Deltaproteobacteria bacterium]
MIRDLIRHVQNEPFVFIQAHNFPDHDAVCAAYGLQDLFRQQGIPTLLVYDGEIERDSLRKVIHQLRINIRKAAEYNLRDEHKIIIVDGCKGNKNVTDLVGEEIAVIDHHQSTSPDDVTFSDIRHHGSCSTLIQGYFVELGLEPSKKAATCLMIGLNMDTALLTRGVTQEDLNAFLYLYTRADMTMVNNILRNQIQTKDLLFYQHALTQVRVADRVAFCYFAEGCNQNLLGILGDFFLALEEVDFVALCARNGNVVNFSLRSEIDEWNASTIIQQVLEGKGFGGGHADMAGGIIKDMSKFNEHEIYHHFMELLEQKHEKYLWGNQHIGSRRPDPLRESPMGSPLPPLTTAGTPWLAWVRGLAIPIWSALMLVRGRMGE